MLRCFSVTGAVKRKQLSVGASGGGLTRRFERGSVIVVGVDDQYRLCQRRKQVIEFVSARGPQTLAVKRECAIANLGGEIQFERRPPPLFLG